MQQLKRNGPIEASSGMDRAVLSEGEALRARRVVAALEEACLHREARDMGSALGQIWILGQRALESAHPEDISLAQAALEGCIARSESLPGWGPLSDLMGLILTRERFRLGFGGADQNRFAEERFLADLRSFPRYFSRFEVAKAVHYGRFFLWRASERRGALEAFLETLDRPGGWQQPSEPLTPNGVQGLAALLGVLARASHQLGRPIPNFPSLVHTVTRGAGLAQNPEGRLTLSGTWEGDRDFEVLHVRERIRPRMTLGGHLGVWTLLARLYRDFPALFEGSLDFHQLNSHLNGLSGYSYFVHKRAGYIHTGCEETTLLTGAAGALHCFQTLYGVTGEAAFLLNARLWARRAMDVLESGPEGPTTVYAIKGGAGGLPVYEVDWTLSRGAPGIALALRACLKEDDQPEWSVLVG